MLSFAAREELVARAFKVAIEAVRQGRDKKSQVWFDKALRIQAQEVEG